MWSKTEILCLGIWLGAMFVAAIQVVLQILEMVK